MARPKSEDPLKRFSTNLPESLLLRLKACLEGRKEPLSQADATRIALSAWIDAQEKNKKGGKQ